MTTSTAQINIGDIVQITDTAYRQSLRLATRAGEKFRVDTISPALQPGDDGYNEPDTIQETLLSGQNARGTIEAPLSSVELVARAADLGNTEPSPADLLRQISYNITGDGPYEFDESFTNRDNIEIVVVHRVTGVRYAFTLTIGPITEAD